MATTNFTTKGMTQTMKIEEMRIMVCDDSMLSRKKIKDFLGTLGCTDVIEAADGALAIENFEKFKPDLTLMDIVMPNLNGVNALEYIKKHYPDAKVVMTSSVGTQETLKDAIKLGATDFLQKPIDYDILKSLIERLCKEA